MALFKFKFRVSSVEERFEKALKDNWMGEAKVESKVEYEMVSLGWFVSILELGGVAIRVSDEEPEGVQPGQSIEMTLAT